MNAEEILSAVEPNVPISYENIETIEKNLIQAKGIVNVVCEAYTSSEHEDLSSALWAVIDLLEGISKALGER